MKKYIPFILAALVILLAGCGDKGGGKDGGVDLGLEITALEVRGVVEDNFAIAETMTIDGDNVSLVGNTFSKQVDTSTSSAVEFEAFDKAGNKTSRTLRID